MEFGNPRDHCAVVAGVGHEKDHSSDLQVALLAGDPALEGLDVGHVRLRLDDGFEPVDIDHCVGASTIAFDGDRDLGSPPQGGTEARSEPLQKRKVRLVPDWVSVWVQRDGELESQDCRHSCRKIERQGVRISALGPCDPCVAGIDPASDLAKAEPTRSPGCRQTIGRPREKHAAAPRTAFARSLPDRHSDIIISGALLAIIEGDPLRSTPSRAGDPSGTLGA